MRLFHTFICSLGLITAATTNGQTITTGVISGSPFCPGVTVNVTYTTTGSFSNNNNFRAQLSNASGSFASPTVIGSRASTVSGTITATIPASAAAGTGYRIRVVSTNPVITGTDNGSNLTIYSSATCGNSWVTTGNAGINAANNFIGTLNNAPLVIRVNNIRSGMIDPNSTITSFGYGSLISNTSGINNTANGFNTLYSNTVGNYNTAIGFESLKYNTSGNYNTALGSSALYSNTYGTHNTAIGFVSLSSNTSGYFNTAIGVNSLVLNSTGFSNTAIGMDAMFNNTGGINNTSTGYHSLYSNTVGQYNTANGASALSGNTTGCCHTAIGQGALYSNSTGSRNSANGWQALYSNTNGSDNTANGVASMLNNNTGSENAAIGVNALYSNTSGNTNTTLGKNSLYSNTTGSGNTGIGYSADVSSGNLNNATAIGNSAVVNTSNKVRIGNTSVTVIEGQVAYTFPSDGRFKSNIKEDAPGLNLILKLKPVTYNFEYSKFSDFLKEKNANKGHLQQKESKKEMGLVAQDVERTLKELKLDVSNLVHIPENESDNYSLAYGELVVPLIRAVQEQQKIIEELKQANESQDKKIAALENRSNGVPPLQSNNATEITRLDNTTSLALLGQNIPNPLTKQTIIPYRIPNNGKDAAIVISNISTGQILKAIPISCKETQLSIDASNLATGTYSYSLYIEGKPVETKRMVIGR